MANDSHDVRRQLQWCDYFTSFVQDGKSIPSENMDWTRTRTCSGPPSCSSPSTPTSSTSSPTRSGCQVQTSIFAAFHSERYWHSAGTRSCIGQNMGYRLSDVAKAAAAEKGEKLVAV
ncbi:hypothetical protein GQ44DRAFT_779839 [Phaeosphaeriaceae sp. PMI808]|nr:hypothetical protein GQ44DRAFT_779839 [Phaeosphaeriaceae sp. PMI808]